jgi:putative SbcD/Mre11-related phosphoesterase
MPSWTAGVTSPTNRPSSPSNVVTFEPVPGAPAAVARADEECLLVIADYHAGYEAGLRYERGVHVASRAAHRRERLLDLADRTAADRVVVAGDLTHAVGDASGTERAEVERLLNALSIPITVVKGNHDGGVGDWIRGFDGVPVDVIGPQGGRIGGLGAVHGHAWPAPEVLTADTVVVGHEHPHLRLGDSVGGSRIEPVWLRGAIDVSAFPNVGGNADSAGTLVVCPAFNDQVPGTGIEDGAFLAPFLPEALASPTAHLLDGTSVGWPVTEADGESVTATSE